MSATKKQQPTATDQLAELDAAAKAARAAEDEARRELVARQRRVTEAKGELTRATSTGEGIEDAEKALQAAQEAADDQALPARVEGLALATRRAEQAAQGFVEPHLHELIEALAPRALAAVDGIVATAAELERAIAEWNDAAHEVSRVGGRVGWFAKRVSRSVPSGDRFGEIRGALERLRMSPPPPPLPTARIESPGAEQEREQRERQEELERVHAMRAERGASRHNTGVQWDRNHPLFEDAA